MPTVWSAARAALQEPETRAVGDGVDYRVQPRASVASAGLLSLCLEKGRPYTRRPAERAIPEGNPGYRALGGASGGKIDSLRRESVLLPPRR